jgi:hypothetical protein
MDIIMNDSQQLYFGITVTILIISIGIFGNVTSCIIFNSKEFTKQPVTICLTVSCLMNLVTIMYLPVIMFSSLWETSSINCKVFNALFHAIIRIQAWMVSIGSLDRLVTLLMKGSCIFEYKTLFKMIGALTITLIICILMSPEIYYLELVHKKKDNISYCSFPRHEGFDWLHTYYKIEYSIMRICLPFIIMTASSVSILRKFGELKKKLFKNKHDHRDRRLFLSLMALDVFFVLFRLPYLIYQLVNDDIFMHSFFEKVLLSIDVISNVFVFLVLIIFNNLYRKLFYELYFGKKKEQKMNTNIFTKY